ncbi:MAG TPA: DUF952 domain-containing protein [Chloroflexota bacterium]|nr:DUF952 domain-containing protein [Chloroflexota bacterium]HUM70271.1 DUF952 domain-containing protein [Chloroflexota bacterium]
MILHISRRAEWETAVPSGLYTADSLKTEGFIHCSTPEQVLIPANERFRGQTDLLLLCIDPTRLAAPLVYEDCYETGMLFPHIYGPLNVTAVWQVLEFPPQADGSFALPPELLP